MPGPFPGMDPYLENPSIWLDFHATMLVTLRAALTEVLPRTLCAWLAGGWDHPTGWKLHIRRIRSDVVVTVLRLLRPQEKLSGADRAAFLAECLADSRELRNAVEIDLLREGLRVGCEPTGGYRVTVKAGGRPSLVVSFGLRDPLPCVAVPLGPVSRPVRLDLSGCFARAYDGAGYERIFDYTQPPVPRLRDADAEWAASLLSSSRL